MQHEISHLNPFLVCYSVVQPEALQPQSLVSRSFHASSTMLSHHDLMPYHRQKSIGANSPRTDTSKPVSQNTPCSFWADDLRYLLQ